MADNPFDQFDLKKPDANPFDQFDTIPRPTQAAPAPADEPGDFMRGLKRTLPELKQLAGGTLAAVGDVTGLDSVRDYGLGVYKAQEDKIAPLQKPTDSASEAWKQVRSGNLGAGVDFLQNAAGYTVGQAAESVAAAGAGAVIGGLAGGAATAPVGGEGALLGAPLGAIGGFVAKQGLKRAVKAEAEHIIAEQVAKGVGKAEAKALGAQYVAEHGAKDVLAKQVAEKYTAQQLGKIGGATAGTVLGQQAMNATMELGSVYPEAYNQAQADGRSLTTGEKAKAVGSSLAAAGLETVADLFNLGVLFRGTKNLGEAAVKTGVKQAVKDYGKRAAVASAEGAAREAGTEGAQTFLERVGANQSLNDADAWRDYIDSAAVGAVGGVLFGAVAGARKADAKVTPKPFGQDPADQARADVFDAQASGDPVAADAAVDKLHAVLTEQGRVQPQDYTPPEQGYQPAPIGYQPAPIGTLSRVAQRATELGATAAQTAAPVAPVPAHVDPTTGEYLPPSDDALKAQIHASMDQQMASRGKITRSATNVPGIVPKRMSVLFDQVKAERKQGITSAHYAGATHVDQPARGSLSAIAANAVPNLGEHGTAAAGEDQPGPALLPPSNASDDQAAAAAGNPIGETGALAGDVAGAPAQGLSYDESTELQDADGTTPSGEPYTHERAAHLQAGRVEGGKVFPVDGGFVVRVPQAAQADTTPARLPVGDQTPVLATAAPTPAPAGNEAAPASQESAHPSVGQPSVSPSDAAGTVPAPVQASPSESAPREVGQAPAQPADSRPAPAAGEASPSPAASDRGPASSVDGQALAKATPAPAGDQAVAGEFVPHHDGFSTLKFLREAPVGHVAAVEGGFGVQGVDGAVRWTKQPNGDWSDGKNTVTTDYLTRVTEEGADHNVIEGQATRITKQPALPAPKADAAVPVVGSPEITAERRRLGLPKVIRKADAVIAMRKHGGMTRIEAQVAFDGLDRKGLKAGTRYGDDVLALVKTNQKPAIKPLPAQTDADRSDLERRAAAQQPKIAALTHEQARAGLAAIGETKPRDLHDPKETLRRQHPDDVDTALAAAAKSQPKAEPSKATAAEKAVHVEGKSSEAATPAVIGASLAKATARTDKDLKAAKAQLLSEIDAAIAAAGSEESVRFPEAKVGNMEMRNGEHRQNIRAKFGHVNFDIVGDGKFAVINTQEALRRFRLKVERSNGFDAKGKPHPTPAKEVLNPTQATRDKVMAEAETVDAAPEKSSPAPKEAGKEPAAIAREIAQAQPFAEFATVRAAASAAIADQLGAKALNGMDRGNIMTGDELTNAVHDGQYQGILAFAESMPVRVTEADIGYALAERAHSGTSHSPEVRGKSTVREYVRLMVNAWRRGIAAAGNDPAALERVTEAFKSLKQGYGERERAYLSSRTGLVSTMIAGAGNFPVRRMEKKNAAVDRKAGEASDFLKKATARMLKAAKAPIDNSPDSELARVRANLAGKEKLQERMKAANAALKKGDDAALKAQGFTDEQIATLKKPDFAGRTGFPAYSLTNNSAEIRRLRARLESAEQRTTEAAAGPTERTINGVRIEENATDDRIRLHFDGKPSEGARADLKGSGWKWSPRNEAWQRQLTDAARSSADKIIKAHYTAKPAALENVEPANPTFYSALAKTIDEAKGAPKRASYGQWKGWLDGAVRRGEFKQSERDWLGLDDWIKSQGDVTKQQLADYVRANQVKVEDVVLGEGDGLPKGWQVVDVGDGVWEVQDANGETRSDGNSREEAIDAAQDRSEAGPTNTKFASYQLPGGSNYRELLLTLPRDEYRSSHFPDTQGYLAHVRFNERTTADGATALFIEEIQSDRHQLGRKHGYNKAQTAEPLTDDEFFEMATLAPGLGETPHPEQLARYEALRARQDGAAHDSGVPDAPFKATDEWAMLAFKRAVIEAAKQGKDAVAWTTGTQQAERYDLSKQVGKVFANKVGDDNYHLTVSDKAGREIFDEFLPENEIENHVGKELAQKIVDDAKTNPTGKTYADLDLKVGGKGMVAFYDKILPAAVNKWAKRFGAKVGEATLITEGEKGNPNPRARKFADVHSLTLTPAMKEAALGGLPLFNTEQAQELDHADLSPSEQEALDRANNASEAKDKAGNLSRAQGEADARERGFPEAIEKVLGPDHASRVEYVRDAAGLPAELRNGVEARNAERDGKVVTAAVFDPATQRVFVLTSVVKTADRAVWNASHEIAGHLGLRALLGDKLDPALNIALQNPTVKQLADAIMADRSMDRSQKTLAAEEALAELAAAVRTGNYAHIESRYGVKVGEGIREQQSLKAAIANFLKRLQALLDDLFGRHVFLDEDVRALLDAAYQASQSDGATSNFDPSKPSILENVEPIAKRAREHSPEVIADIEAVMNAGQDKTLLQQARDKLASLVPGKIKDEYRPTWLAALSTDMLTEILADHDPGARFYSEFLKAMNADRNELQQQGEEIAEALRQWGSKHPTEAKNLFKLMHQATVDGVDPAKEYQPLQFRFGGKLHEVNAKNIKEARKAIVQQMRERSGDSKQDMLNEIKALKAMLIAEPRRKAQYPTLKSKWDALTSEAQEHYIAMRDAYAERSAMVEEGLVQRIQDTDAPDNHKRKLITMIRQQFETQRLQGVYFPLQRFGQYFVSASRGETDTFLMFESLNKLEAGVKTLKSKGFSINAQGLKSQGKAIDAPSGTFVADVIAKLKAAHISEATQDDIYQMYLQALPELSMRKHSIHRQSVPGFDPDAARGFAFNMLHGAHQIARLRYAHKLADTITLLKAQQEGKRKEETADTRKIAAGDAILNELQLRHQWIMNPTDSKLTGMVSSFGFIYYLGITPAAALVNMTQTALLTFPYLAARHGPVKAMNHLLRGMRDSIRSGGHIQKLLTDPDELAMHAELQRRGILDKTQAYNLSGIAEGGLTGHNPKWAKAMQWIGLPFHKAEVVNREASSIAAYRLAREDGKSHEAAVDAAARAVNDTHFDYCVDTKTECLTLDGWKRFDQLTAGDIAIATNDAGEAVESRILDVNVFDGTHKVTEFSGKPRRFSMVVTPNHECAIQTYDSGTKKWYGPKLVRAEMLKNSHHLLRAPLAPLAGRDGTDTDFAALLGWISAEGHYAKFRNCKAKSDVRLAQSITHNPEYVDEIRALLSRIAVTYSEQKPAANGTITWTIGGDLRKRVLAAMPEKVLTFDMLRTMSAAEMRSVLDAFAKGDGHARHSGSWTIAQRPGLNAQNLHVLQAMATALGMSSTLSTEDDRRTVLLVTGNGKRQTKRTMVKQLARTEREVDTVWCPTTETGTWIARRNGAVFVTGNTNQNRARVFQSGTAKTLLMFRQYSLNMTWHMGRMLWQATKNEDAEVKKIARRNLAGVLGMSALFSGTLGLPLMSVTFGILNAIAASLGDDDEPWDAETEFRAFLNDMFGEGAGNVIANGGVNAITGADIASRVSLSQLWFRDADRELDGRGAYYNLLEQAAGPMGGVLKNALVGKQMIDEGHVMRGIETMLPKALKDTLKAQRYATEGVNNLRGDPLVADVSLRDTLLQLAGFTPDQVAKQYDVNRSLKNYEQAILDRRGYLLDAFAMALRMDDDEARSETLAKIRQFNQANPELAITTAGIRRSLGSRARYSADAEHGISLNRHLAAKVHAMVDGDDE